MGGNKQLKPFLHANQFMRIYFITRASSTVVTLCQFQTKCITYDIKWKFPTMNTLHTSLRCVGVYTGFPVAYLCLTQEEGREEMWRHVFIHEAPCGSNPLAPRHHMSSKIFIYKKTKTCRNIKNNCTTAFTHLVMFLQVFLIISDSCSQISHCVKKQL